MKRNKVKIIGITGGIGSGKSEASKILGNIGAYVINADLIGNQVILRGNQAYYEIVEVFGDAILKDDLEIDRKKLGDIVFKDKDKLNILNNITHIQITKNIIELIEVVNLKNENKLIVIDAALPFKEIFGDLTDEIWVISADIEIRIARIMKRNKVIREKAEERINMQLKDDEYFLLADRIIYNNLDFICLKEKILEGLE